MGEKSMGETLLENFVKRMGEKRWAKVMGENFIKVWVKTL